MKTLATSLLVAASIAVVMTGCKPAKEAGPTSEHPTVKSAAEHPAADHTAAEHPTPAPTNKPGKPLDHPAH